MNCPRCNASVDKIMNRCSQCGQPILVYKKVIRISNSLYNIGLEKARIRDLSGAIDALNKSLRYNKENVNARNLLGLVYYEMGETVKALTEWILSKNIQPDNNEANYYIDSIQSNPTQLECVNQTIKKYNSALLSAKQGSEDLAIIQLKKVVNLNPRFIRAFHLLALLYMSVGEKELAIKSLNKIRKIDINNTTTIKYLKELGALNKPVANSQNTAVPSGERKVFKGDSNVQVKSVGSYKPDKPKATHLINIIIGVIIGLFISIVLVLPTLGQKNKDDNSSDVSAYGEKLATQESMISSLEYDKTALQSQIEELEKQLEDSKKDESLSVAEVYENILEAYKLYNDGKVSEALAIVVDIDMSEIKNDTATAIVEKIQGEDAMKASADVFEKGRVAYNSAKYEEALEYLEEALNLNPDNYDAYYFLGRLYHKQGDKEKAEKYYKKVVNDYPDSPRCSEAKARLSELGISATE